jgi:anaphase-promoting complex subunit 5
MSFVKLSFSGVIKLQSDFQAWVEGNLTAGYQVVNKEQPCNGKFMHVWFIMD